MLMLYTVIKPPSYKVDLRSEEDTAHPASLIAASLPKQRSASGNDRPLDLPHCRPAE